MKIMMLSGYMFLEGIPGFEKCSSGFGIVVGNIAKGLAEKDEVFVLTQSAFTDAHEIGNLKILPRTQKDMLRSFSPRYIKYWMQDIRGSRKISQITKGFFYYMTGSYVEKLIRKVQPDVVSISGIGLSTQPFLYACQNTGVPYILSLHGINCRNADNGNNLMNPLYQLEKRAAQNAAGGKYPVTVVSTGIKNWIFETGENQKDGAIYVVPNGQTVNFAEFADSRQAVRTKLHVGIHEKVYICAGTVSYNKNQLQLLRAFAQLPWEIQSNSRLLIVGDGSQFALAKETAEKLHISDRVIFTGRVPQETLFKLYSAADINVLVTRCEGFGNSVIEGFQFGIPSVVFSDLDAIPDMDAPGCMVTVKDRTDEALCAGLQNAYERSWNGETIREHGRKFTTEAMISGYRKAFTECAQCFLRG